MGSYHSGPSHAKAALEFHIVRVWWKFRKTRSLYSKGWLQDEMWYIKERKDERSILGKEFSWTQGALRIVTASPRPDFGPSWTLNAIQILP